MTLKQYENARAKLRIISLSGACPLGSMDAAAFSRLQKKVLKYEDENKLITSTKFLKFRFMETGNDYKEFARSGQTYKEGMEDDLPF